MLVDLGQGQIEATTIYYDNRSIIAITRNPIMHDMIKHIQIWLKFIRDLVKRGFNKSSIV